MTRLICFGPTHKEVQAGETRRHMGVSGADVPPVPHEQTGPDGAGGYIFRQDDPATRWLIAHGLNAYPNVTVQDTSGVDQEVIAEYLSANEVRLTFSEPTQGVAWVSTRGDV